jgi:hypothetical protein
MQTSTTGRTGAMIGSLTQTSGAIVLVVVFGGVEIVVVEFYGWGLGWGLLGI